jgi:hypothetical protein
MRSIGRLPVLALTAALLLAGVAVPQAPDQKQDFPPGFARPAPLGVDDVVERIMAFDKNKDGKVTRDELPERMQFLIELGDTNKDGALDRDEIKKLAVRLATAPGGFGTGGGIRFGAGPVPRPGPGVPGGFGVGGQIRFGGPDAAAGVVDDLKLPAKKRDQAMAAVRAHQEKVRKLTDQAQAELLQTMKEILSEEEFKDFEAALDRPRGVTVINVGPGDAPRGGVERKPEQPPK